jgi:tetratricopeptide (TPR) repeat protein
MQLAAEKKPPESVKRQLAERALSLLEHAPDDAESWEAKGRAYQFVENQVEALAAYERAIAVAPWRESALMQAAEAAEQLGRLRSALDYRGRLLAGRPDLWLSHYHVARLQAGVNDWDRALDGCQKALRINPFSHESRLLEVQCLLALGRKDRARVEFATFLALRPPGAEEWRHWFAEQTK